MRVGERTYPPSPSLKGGGALEARFFVCRAMARCDG